MFEESLNFLNPTDSGDESRTVNRLHRFDWDKNEYHQKRWSTFVPQRICHIDTSINNVWNVYTIEPESRRPFVHELFIIDMFKSDATLPSQYIQIYRKSMLSPHDRPQPSNGTRLWHCRVKWNAKWNKHRTHKHIHLYPYSKKAYAFEVLIIFIYDFRPQPFVVHASKIT